MTRRTIQMPPPRNASDPKHWRDRAAQMRSLAVTMMGTQAAILMNDLRPTTTSWPESRDQGQWEKVSIEYKPR